MSVDSAGPIDAPPANLVRDVRDMLREDDLERVRAVLAGLPPADVADLLEEIDADDRGRVFEMLDSETAGEVLGEVGPADVSILAADAPDSLQDAVEEMELDELADVLDALPDKHKDALLDSLPSDDAEDLRELLVHAPDTAGGIMTPEFIVLPADITAAQAIRRTQESHETETVAHLFVQDAGGRLAGYIPLHRLVFAHHDRALGEIMAPVTHTVQPETDREDVVRIATKYDLDVMAVVDEDGRLCGVIMVDDILEAAQEEADEDMYRLAGTSERDPVHATAVRSARLRLPWLLLSLAGGIMIAWLVTRFGAALDEAPQLAFFIPLIPLMGGNVAIQASTIVVRGLAVGNIQRGRAGAFVSKQVGVNLMLALCCGTAAGLAAGIMSAGMSLVVGVAVFLAIMVAGTLGTVMPLAFHKAGFDPAVSTGPFVTILNDLFCIGIYLTLGVAMAVGA